MKKRNVILVFIVMIFATAGCGFFNSSDNEKPLSIDEKTAKLVRENNHFGFDLFQQVYQYEDEAKNVMISPLSVALALAMTYNGAEGETKEAMEKTLRLYGLTSDDINSSYRALVAGLQLLDPKVMLEIANAIFYRDDFQVEKNFIEANLTYYNADVSAIDFGSSSALEIINGWVNEKTYTKIPSILDRVDPSHVMFLLNAIYFKGTWTKEFNKEGTVSLPFYVDDKNTVEVEFMGRVDTVDYLKNELFSGIKLPYGQQDFNMYVLLPGADKTLDDLVLQLNYKNWAVWLPEFKSTNTVDICFPKFKFPYEIKLNDVLTDMGMGVAFTGLANFTGINRDGGLSIDYVKHKSFIEVNEEGTEAAAVTIVAIRKNSSEIQEKTVFHANRPFLFLITEKTSGAILFMGTVKDPTITN